MDAVKHNRNGVREPPPLQREPLNRKRGKTVCLWNYRRKNAPVPATIVEGFLKIKLFWISKKALILSVALRLNFGAATKCVLKQLEKT